MKYILLLIGVLVFVLPSAAQKERKLIREGNGLYDEQEFEKAEVEYRKALDKKAESYEAAFNLGDALYKQKKYDEALRQFAALAEQEKDVIFGGRLAEYKYYDMDDVIASAFAAAEKEQQS